MIQAVKGRRGRGVDKAWAHRMLLLRAAYRLSDAAVHRMAEVFAAVDPTGKLQAEWKLKEQLRALLRTDSLADAAETQEELKNPITLNDLRAATGTPAVTNRSSPREVPSGWRRDTHPGIHFPMAEKSRK
ncbi:MAG: hypothetical protein WB535_19190, partial [Paenarthrobacter sp.]